MTDADPEEGNDFALDAEGWGGGPADDDETMVDLGGGMVVPLSELMDDEP